MPNGDGALDTDAMSMIETTKPAIAPALPNTLRLGAVHLMVADVDRAVAWYERSLGLRVHAHGTAAAELGDGAETVVVLHVDPQAVPAGRHAGLYHYALLYPTREELARAAVRLARTRTPIQGASDHGTHEAIYLPDADGIGIELAWDRDREQWPVGLGYDRGPAPLDFESLLGTVAGEQPTDIVAERLRMGHLHLHVGDIDRALAFYRDSLGFEVQAHLGSAAFVSVGGYHHHLGLNVWNGRGVDGPPPHTAGLRRWTVQLPTDADVTKLAKRIAATGTVAEPVADGFEVRDPWGKETDPGRTRVPRVRTRSMPRCPGRAAVRRCTCPIRTCGYRLRGAPRRFEGSPGGAAHRWSAPTCREGLSIGHDASGTRPGRRRTDDGECGNDYPLTARALVADNSRLALAGQPEGRQITTNRRFGVWP
jgi:catechol 2,3-dioxygenase